MKLAFPEENAEVAFTGALTSKEIDIQDMIFIDKEKPTIKPWDLEQPLKSTPLPPTLSAEATVQLGTVRFGKLKADSVRGRITLKNGVFTMDNLDVAAYQGKLTGNTVLTFSDIDNVTYNGGFSLNGFQSGAFIADFFDTDDFFRGSLSSSLKFSGAGLDSVSMLDNLTGSGNMRFENGEIDNWEFTKKLGAYLKFLDFTTLKFETIANSFTIKDRQLITPDMTLKTADGGITLNGTTGFDTSIDYTMTFALNEAASKKAVAQLSSLSQWIKSDPGAIELDVTAGGTLKSPSFGLDTTKAQNKLKAAVKEEVKEKVSDTVQELIEKNIQDEDLQEKGKDLLKKLLR